MYPDNKKRVVEHTSVAEELLFEVPELESKCRAVEKAVRESYFTLQEALRNYKVSEVEYISYGLMKNRRKLKRARKQDQVFDTIAFVVSIFDPSIKSFNIDGRQAMHEIKKISDKASANKKPVIY
ncbi:MULTISPECIES: hypothetical protein [unclassified Spirosoma]|uniref:hypothetical protein n=1 Tax=unclassified Spirosoma TaxID=2621999 RepID=UPI00095DAB1F|nr:MULTISPECIES: hypothetical protein [unclassified Spirosoma]MBN8821088.1 hypothetical protein [Spirosoma sp.]OJW79273.1 MAG: hypothetical protein BGO59_12080 [Spirosoma sp. 48-14]